MNPIYKFNNGRGATLCHLCRTIITTGKMTNDLYCDRCLKERNSTEEEFNKVKANLKKNLNTSLKSFESAMLKAQYEAVKANFTMEEYYDQMDKEVHFNRSDLNK